MAAIISSFSHTVMSMSFPDSVMPESGMSAYADAGGLLRTSLKCFAQLASCFASVVCVLPYLYMMSVYMYPGICH